MIGQTNKQTNRDYNYICIDDNDDDNDNDNDNDNDIIDVANDIKNKNLNFASTTLLLTIIRSTTLLLMIIRSTTLLLMIIRLKITLCDPYLETKYCIIARLKNKQVIFKA